MKTKDSFKQKVILADVSKTTKSSDSISWRGNVFLKFTLQLNIRNMNVKIYASNIESPDSGDWIDMTDYFTSSATITADTLLIQSDDVCVLWWKMTWAKTNNSNGFVANLYQYGEKL